MQCTLPRDAHSRRPHCLSSRRRPLACPRSCLSSRRRPRAVRAVVARRVSMVRDRSSQAGGSGVEPRSTGMVRREVGETGRGTSRTGPPGRSVEHPACRPLRSRRFFLNTSIRPVSNASSGESGEVPEDVVDAHLGNLPGKRGHASRGGRTWSRNNSVSRV